MHLLQAGDFGAWKLLRGGMASSLECPTSKDVNPTNACLLLALGCVLFLGLVERKGKHKSHTPRYCSVHNLFGSPVHDIRGDHVVRGCGIGMGCGAHWLFVCDLVRR
jgi:hypothetical protein